MPISPEKRALYPREWKAISLSIREAAGQRCQGSPRYPDCRAANREPHPVTGSRVVLTVAHLNHDPTDNRPENLRALCQRCHLTHDAEHHAKNARRTRNKRIGVLDLFDAGTDPSGPKNRGQVCDDGG